MKLLSTIIILSSFLVGLNVQSETISGIVKSDFGENLHDVSIIVKGTEKPVVSNCAGKFKIQAELGDTLFISKVGYIPVQTEIKKHHRNKIILSFDYAKFRDNIEQDSAFNKSIYLNASEPLYIIDGRAPESSYYLSIKDNLTEEDILPIIIMKGKKATDLFGRCAMNGAIWVRTKCGYLHNPKTK